MNTYLRNSIVTGTFLLIALFGVVLSLSASYATDGDELTYLVGTLQAHEGTLPDAPMLQSYNDGPYLYPQIMYRWYEPLGFDAFKSIYLIFLVLVTGLCGYALFRMLGLPWIPSLLFSVVLLMPRFSSGLETFGVLTFNEAQGRAMAVPLFLLASAFLISRLGMRKSLWPVFILIGLCEFLHPVTVMLFAFIALVGVAITQLIVHRTSLVRVLCDTFVSGAAFVLAGSYFFVYVFERLGKGVSSTGVSAASYVQAVLARVAWDFPPASLVWFRHMVIVSALFVALLIAFYTVPRLRALRTRHLVVHSREMVVWGLSVAIGSLVLCVLLPGLNLYLMEHADMSYIFQQWSRICKFYYLGLFIALVPCIYALWGWYCESTYRFKHAVLALFFVLCVASSSFGFEVTQFFIGYPNFETAYIPQTLSHVPSNITEAEYQQTCTLLSSMGATSETLILSSDFALRYYCRSKLYTTSEEGAAYLQLSRGDLVDWYDREVVQDQAFANGPAAIVVFAEHVGATFIVADLPRYAGLEMLSSAEVATTSRQIVVKISP
jgi:hypothetical protein